MQNMYFHEKIQEERRERLLRESAERRLLKSIETDHPAHLRRLAGTFGRTMIAVGKHLEALEQREVKPAFATHTEQKHLECL